MSGKASGLLWPSALLGAAAPLVVAFGAMGSDIGWISFEVGFWLLTLTVAGWLALAGVILGLFATLTNRRILGRAWPRLVAGLLLPAATLTGIMAIKARMDETAPVHETATDWERPLGFSNVLLAARGPGAHAIEADPRVPDAIGQRRSAWQAWAGRRVAEVNAETCPEARTIPRLAEPDEVIAALEAEGVRVIGQSPWRVEGVRESAFYGRARDVVVRMEPGATDIRVSERIGEADLGDTCDLAASLVRRLSR